MPVLLLGRIYAFVLVVQLGATRPEEHCVLQAALLAKLIYILAMEWVTVVRYDYLQVVQCVAVDA
jgi:hypothetical protein